MIHATTNRLDNGITFPNLELRSTDGRSLILPGEFVGRWGIVLFYRGDW